MVYSPPSSMNKTEKTLLKIVSLIIVLLASS